MAILPQILRYHPPQQTISGIGVIVDPTDASEGIEIQRTDDSSGSPDANGWQTVTVIPQAEVIPGGTLFIDALPVDGRTWWYRARQTQPGFTPTTLWSTPVSGEAQFIINTKLNLTPSLPISRFSVTSTDDTGSFIHPKVFPAFKTMSIADIHDYSLPHINGAGSLNMQANPNFALAANTASNSTDTFALGWAVNNFNSTFASITRDNQVGFTLGAAGYDALIAILGNQSQSAGTNVGGQIISSQHYPCVGGQTYCLSFWYNTQQVIAPPAGIAIQTFGYVNVGYSNGSGSTFITPINTGQVLGNTNGNANYVRLSAQFTAPISASVTPTSMQAVLQTNFVNTTTASLALPNAVVWNVRYANVSLTRVSVLDDEVMDGMTYGRVQQLQLDGTGIISVLQPTAMKNDGASPKSMLLGPQQFNQRHGDVVTFPATYQNIPFVRAATTPGVTHEARSLWGTDVQIIAQSGNSTAYTSTATETDQFGYSAITTSGMTCRLRLAQPGFTYSAQSADFANPNSFLTPGTGSTLSLGANIPAYNDQYTVNGAVYFTIFISPGFGSYTAAQVVLIDYSTNSGTSWTQAGSANVSVTVGGNGGITGSFATTITAAGLPASTTQFRLRASSNASCTHGSAVAKIHGDNVTQDSTHGITWTSGSGVTNYASKTPNSTDYSTMEVYGV